MKKNIIFIILISLLLQNNTKVKAFDLSTDLSAKQIAGLLFLGGGCYGLGAIYPLAKAFKEAGNKVIAMLEARTTYIIYNEEKLREVTDEIIIVTADGSRGVTGHIKDGMKFLEERNEKIDHAHFVGCTFMMMLSAEATKPYGIPTIVSLNTLMVDGTGMCGVCRVLVDGEIRPSLSVQKAQALIAKGIIKGGMVAKMESAFEALNQHVPRVHIIQWQGAHTLHDIIKGKSESGTTVTP